MHPNLRILQNGSDIRGVALSGVPGEEVNLTPEIAGLFGKAFITWYAKHSGEDPQEIRLAIGTDSRISGPVLKEAFAQGVIECGASVLDAGLSTTPAMFMATQFEETACDVAVMLTASHLPFNRNGFKFFTRKSGLEKKDIAEVISLAEANSWETKGEPGTMEKTDLLALYSRFLCGKIRTDSGMVNPLEGKKIVVDAGNGAGGFFAKEVLQELGADTSGSLYLDPDGNFPNHIPNPEDKVAINSLIEAVKSEQADLGIIFDTDVDRAAVVDETGRPVNRNRLIALLAAIVLEEHPGTTIVTDSVTSEGLKTFISRKGGKHFRYRRGYRNVINKSIELNTQGEESWLAIETSGHGALRENFFLDDGAFLTAKILVKFALLAKEDQTISDLFAELEEPLESEEFRLKIEAKDFKDKGERVIAALKEFAKKQSGWEIEPENYEGVRVSCAPEHGNGWLLLRLSLHDPVLPLNIESQQHGGVTLIASKLKAFLKEFDFIKTESLS